VPRVIERIRTPRLLLRAWRDDDLPAYAALNADARVMEHFPSMLTPDESDLSASRIRRNHEERGFALWAVEVPGTASFIGFIGLQVPGFDAHFQPCVEIGWRLAHAHWGHGYATEGARASLAVAFGDLGLEEVVSMTTTTNDRSQRVMKKLGMRRDAADDFDHPKIAEGHPLRRHVLYRTPRSEAQSPV
jgi:ribosomal-protein-alanine N-acetyltransferase